MGRLQFFGLHTGLADKAAFNYQSSAARRYIGGRGNRRYHGDVRVCRSSSACGCGFDFTPVSRLNCVSGPEEPLYRSCDPQQFAILAVARNEHQSHGHAIAARER